uniref:sugar nucleotide-binding protein n=1 Tax=Paracoccus sp. TaxID=267 RepID=UPI0028AAB337
IAAAGLAMLGAMRADGGLGGLYHFSGAPDTSWAGFAREIMAQAGLSCRITDIPTTDYPTPARRPANSRLNCAAIFRDFGISRPDWRAGLAQVLQELKP